MRYPEIVVSGEKKKKKKTNTFLLRHRTSIPSDDASEGKFVFLFLFCERERDSSHCISLITLCSPRAIISVPLATFTRISLRERRFVINSGTKDSLRQRAQTAVYTSRSLSPQVEQPRFSDKRLRTGFLGYKYILFPIFSFHFSTHSAWHSLCDLSLQKRLFGDLRLFAAARVRSRTRRRANLTPECLPCGEASSSHCNKTRVYKHAKKITRSARVYEPRVNFTSRVTILFFFFLLRSRELGATRQ